MQRLKTRAQFQAAMAGGTIARTPHFALHRLLLVGESKAHAEMSVLAETPPSGPDDPQSRKDQALFVVPGVWIGAMAPKRWARRAVTRNAIKRQIYAVASEFEARLPQAAFVVRLRSTFDRKQFLSATSDVLKRAVRQELLQLFQRGTRGGDA